MKLASYIKNGDAAFGVVVGDGLVTLNGRLARRVATLRDAIDAACYPEMARIAAAEKPDLSVRDVTFLPLIPNPKKILCVGLNYRDHVAELAGAKSAAEVPGIFVRFPGTLLGHGQAMQRPRASTMFDYEGELAVIIGKPGRHIPVEQALEHVAGYTCFVDGSVRDFQKQSVAAGKNFWASGPLGPWMLTADEMPDPRKFVLTTRLNGVQVQHSGLDMLIHSIPECINYLSKVTPLEPGDVIATGTPAGVGHRRTPPLWLKAGDRLEVEISGIGTLANPVIDEL